MLKLIISLIWNRAKKKEFQLQIGAYLLKKGADIQLDQVLYTKKRKFDQKNRVKAKVVENIVFDFRSNKVIPTTVNRNVNAKKIKLIK